MSGMMASEIDVQVYRETLEEMRKRLDGPDLKYPVETRMSRGDASDEIVRQAEELECGLIVMGTHGRTGLGKLLMGKCGRIGAAQGSLPGSRGQGAASGPDSSLESIGEKSSQRILTPECGLDRDSRECVPEKEEE